MRYILIGALGTLIGFILSDVFEEISEWKDTTLGFIAGILLTATVLYFVGM